MYGDAKKLHLIEEILRIDNDALLEEVETVLTKSKGRSVSAKNFTKFAGIWTEQEANDMKRFLEESCEQINPDDWK